MRRIGAAAVLAACAAAASCATEGSGSAGPEGRAPVPALEAASERIRPLHEKKKPPGPHDWLSRHDEPGQSFAEYRRSDPVRPTEERARLYVLLLGPFSETQRAIVRTTASFLSLYFCLPVSFADPLGLDVIPPKARRTHPAWGVPQLHAGHILDRVLRSRVPDDAVALLAFTARDLWPGPGWNFVFGMASLRGRVGVWSLARFGDPDASPEAYRLCLLRTLKTGTHETGHMLGMRHCTAWECNMNGSNHLEESDRGPLALCPACAAKVWWATGCDPAQRDASLEAFCRQKGLDEQADFYARRVRALGAASGN